ncbi:MAG: hypothetical protein K6E90_05105 [Lachnospiraceae bacterium]|nr:hypothetical protein [Lachnospiraceae bacterium]
MNKKRKDNMTGIEEYKRIYEMLDAVSPLSYDCGKLCGAVCCRDESFDDGSGPYIYLLPGEKEYLESLGADLHIEKKLSADHCLPASFGKYVYVTYCKGPGDCDRSIRPVQCRTFPLAPYITKEGDLAVSFYDEELPYVCPLIKERRRLSREFIQAVLDAWSILIGDVAIRDLVLMDSVRVST